MATNPFEGRLLKDRYEVASELGRGGMATVYLARDRDLDRQVVVKVPDAALLQDDSFRTRFDREVKSMVALHHPHVVSVLDAGEDDGLPFVVLEFLEGGSLKDRLDAKVSAGERESPAEILTWLEPVARALDAINAHDVVHRDMKPANILFDAAGNPFVSDFGVSKALGAPDTNITATGATPGTPTYMAPEVGKSGRLSGAADQYSLAVLLYEALAGFVPLEGETPIAVMLRKITEDPDPIQTHCPDLPAAAARAVMKALSREPEDRFGSCAELAAAFRAGLAGEEMDVPVATKVEEDVPVATVVGADESRRRRSWKLPALIGGAIVVLAAAFLILKGSGGGDAPPSPGPDTPVTPPTPGPKLTVTAPNWKGKGRWTRAREAVIAGTVETDGLVELRVGGTAFRPREDGSFAKIVALDVGLNEIPVTARNEAGEENRIDVELVLDIFPPKLWLFRPQDGLISRSPDVEVNGRVEDENMDRVVVNGEKVPLAADLTFSTTVTLEEGDNPLKIEVYDRAGKHRIVERSVLFDTVSPEIELNPLPERTTEDSVRVFGKLSEPGCKVTINGEAAPISHVRFGLRVPLKPGANEIVVRAVDRGRNSARVTVSVYRDPGEPVAKDLDRAAERGLEEIYVGLVTHLALRDRFPENLRELVNTEGFDHSLLVLPGDEEPLRPGSNVRSSFVYLGPGPGELGERAEGLVWLHTREGLIPGHRWALLGDSMVVKLTEERFQALLQRTREAVK